MCAASPHPCWLATRQPAVVPCSPIPTHLPGHSCSSHRSSILLFLHQLVANIFARKNYARMLTISSIERQLTLPARQLWLCCSLAESWEHWPAYLCYSNYFHSAQCCHFPTLELKLFSHFRFSDMWDSVVIWTHKLSVKMGDSVLVRAVFKFKGTNNDEVKMTSC